MRAGGSPGDARPPRARAHALVAVVCVAAAWLLVDTAPTLATAWRAAIIWLALTLAAELLWVPTVTGRATSSMAATVNLASLFVLGPAAAVWTVAIAAGLATRVIQGRSWLKALFNLAQAALATAAAGWVYVHAGGMPVTIDSWRDPAALVPFLNAGVAFFLVNTTLVAAVIGLWEGLPVPGVWRRNFGYADDLLTTLALFLLSPLMVLAHLTAGLTGAALCFVPMLLVRNAARRYLELHDAQQAVLWNERMAAMGEMAAEIGHELGNVLQVISAQAQMLLTEADGARGHRAERAARQIFERAIDMRRLAKGLMDFSHREVAPRPERLGALVRETVEMLELQKRYDGVEWRLDLDRDDPPVVIDGGQIRQVLVNLFRNAAEAMAGRQGRRIAVSTVRGEGAIQIEVADSGPGIAPEILDRVFEPWLTTKPDGHGFGLAVSYRIVRNHGGNISARNAPGGGAVVVIELPAGDRAAGRLAA